MDMNQVSRRRALNGGREVNYLEIWKENIFKKLKKKWITGRTGDYRHISISAWSR